MTYKYPIIILLFIALFFVSNSIIWLRCKTITNINDLIIKYIIYLNYLFIVTAILYLVLYNDK